MKPIETIIAQRLDVLKPSTTTQLDTPRQYITHVLDSEESRELVAQKLKEMYPDGFPEDICNLIDESVQLILKLKADELAEEVQQRADLRKKLLQLIDKPSETARKIITALNYNQVYTVAEPIILQADDPDRNGEVQHTRNIQLSAGCEITQLEATQNNRLYGRYVFLIKGPAGLTEVIEIYVTNLPKSIVIEE